MTVSSAINKHIYQGNGVNRIWPYSFKLEDSEHLHVFLSGPDQLTEEITDGFLVDRDNKFVEYPVLDPNPAAQLPVLKNGEGIVLVRLVPYLQELDLENQGAFHAERIENEFDLIVMMIQQLSERLSRCMSFPANFSADYDAELILQMVQLNYERYPLMLEASEICTTAQFLVLPARDQTLEYLNTTEALVNKALSSTADAWDALTFYVYPEVVAAPDGFTYRCISQEGVTGEYPPTSPYWCRLIVDLEEFFTWDNEGDLMPEAYPMQSSKWSIDSVGDIFPIY